MFYYFFDCLLDFNIHYKRMQSKNIKKTFEKKDN